MPTVAYQSYHNFVSLVSVKQPVLHTIDIISFRPGTQNYRDERRGERRSSLDRGRRQSRKRIRLTFGSACALHPSRLRSSRVRLRLSRIQRSAAPPLDRVRRPLCASGGTPRINSTAESFMLRRRIASRSLLTLSSVELTSRVTWR